MHPLEAGETETVAYDLTSVLFFGISCSLAELQWRLQKLSDRKNVWHEADAFLYDLERVERVQVRLGHQVKILHLNLTGMSQRTLEMMGFKEMLKETIEVDFKL